MSAVFTLMNKERGGIGLKAQVLLYPVTDADFDTPSYLRFAEGYYFTRDGMKWFWDAYIPDPAPGPVRRATPSCRTCSAGCDPACRRASRRSRGA